MYDDELAGNEIHTETQTVMVVDGLYSTSMGLSNASPGRLSAALMTNTAVWLELEISGTPLTPRSRIVSVAYALTSAGVLPGAINQEMLPPDAVTSANILDGTISNADISGTANIAPGKIQGI